jgi:hypothetical protein
MKKIEDLTTEQEEMLDPIAERYLRELIDPPPFSMPPVIAWLDVVYQLYEMPVYQLYEMPRPSRIEVVDSPFAALRMASELTDAPQSTTDWCGVSDSGWLAFYEVFERIGVLSEDETVEIRALREFGRIAWDMILMDECAIVIRRPASLHVDDDGNLHSSSGPVIEWHDGEKDFAYHGTWIPERMVTDPLSYTRAEYLAITNTEERRALSEIAGWNWVMRLLGGSTVDEWIDPHTRLRYELIVCQDMTQRLLRKQSPPLQNGEQPFYIEPVHEGLRTARAARKWQATDLTPEECEGDPELEYEIET